MCGFAALFEPGRVFAPDLLAAIDRDLFHRGPDSGGQASVPGMAMVFRRLAIMDPTPVSDQPMRDPDGRYTLMFNGEIYNQRALRRALESEGVRFHTASGDTEVLMQALIHWGESALPRLEGMYAFVFADAKNATAIAARDPLGIKPLYVAKRGRFTGFASEAAPLTRFVGAEADPAALAELLMFRFAAGRLSNYRGIERVPGGHFVRVSLADGATSEHRFCDPLDELHEPDAAITYEQADELAEQAIRQSVIDHLQSDVGFCVQLSGGIDSSLVSAISSREFGKPVQSFGINLQPWPQDEKRWRDAIAAQYGLEHHEVKLTGADYAEALPQAVARMEGPIAHTGCVLLMLLCKEIARHKKVVLTGEGADEFFGGYSRYQNWKQIERRGRIGSLVPPSLWPYLDRWREYRRYARQDAASTATIQGDFLATAEIFPGLIPPPGAREHTAGDFSDFRSRMFAVDQSAYLESLLLRQDKMAMTHSLEARVPFAHWPLARVVNRFPHHVRAPGGDTKPVLKRIAERYLPRDLVRRKKVGLTIPAHEWIADEKALGRYLPLLTDADSRLAQWTDARTLRGAVDAFRRGERHALPPFEHLIGVELWLRSVARLPLQAAA
jgi:asparagine synthase (glutamine-hydrolysing)